MTTLRFVVKGRVQGVGFRFFAARVAGCHAITGWVRNLPDGSVETLARGVPAALEAFRRDLERGPAGAKVVSVDESDAETGEELSGFDIRF